MKSIIGIWYSKVYENAGLTRSQTSYNDRELMFQPIRSLNLFCGFGSLSFPQAKKRWERKLKKMAKAREDSYLGETDLSIDCKSIVKDVLGDAVVYDQINTRPWALEQKKGAK